MQLITGGMGFIGLHTAQALLRLSEPCVLTTASGTVRDAGFVKRELGKRIFIEQLDVADKPALLELGKKHRITGIVHLSGVSVAGSCQDMRNNTLHLLNVLEAAELWRVRRLAIASSIGVYAGGVLDTGPLREDQLLPLTSIHPIPGFKKIVELFAAIISAAAPQSIVCFRFGAWGPLSHHPPSPMNLFGQMVRAAVEGRTLDFAQPQSRAFAEDGMDLVYVKDCARAIAKLQTADRLTHRVYNIGAGYATRNREFADALKAEVPGATIHLPEGFDPRGPGRPLALDNTRIRQDIGFEPEYDVRTAVAEYVGWLRAGNAY